MREKTTCFYPSRFGFVGGGVLRRPKTEGRAFRRRNDMPTIPTASKNSRFCKREQGSYTQTVFRSFLNSAIKRSNPIKQV